MKPTNDHIVKVKLKVAGAGSVLASSLPSTTVLSTKKSSKNRLDDANIVSQIAQLKIEKVALDTIIELHALEQHIEEAIMLFELNGSLPGKITEAQLRERLKEVASEIHKWQTVSDYASLSDELRNLHELRELRKGNLVDSAEADLVVANVLKDPLMFTDIDFLANGSYGTVYRAKYCGQSQVVVKILNSGLIKSRDAELQFFLNEVRNMMSIQGHDRILPILGALPYNDAFPEEWKYDQNGLPCKPHAIVMPFMSHGTLEDLLEKNNEKRRKAKIPLWRKYEIALEICEGMTWIANRELVHGDLKPENIFFDKYWSTKIGDVGLSTLLTPRHSITNTTASPVPASNDVYANHQVSWWTAPEVLQLYMKNNTPTTPKKNSSATTPTTITTTSTATTTTTITSPRAASCKSDVYSVSILFWQLFTDTPTNKFAKLFAGIIYKFEESIITGARLPLPTTFKPSLKKSKKSSFQEKYPDLYCHNLQQILQKSWDGNPENRPQMNELITMFTESLIHTYLPDTLCPDASLLWGKFDNPTKVPFDKFVAHLMATLDCEVSEVQERWLTHFLIGGDDSEKDVSERVVSLPSLSNLLKWFGPLKSVLPTMDALVSQTWFCKALDNHFAFERVKLSPKGYCIVRLNPSPTLQEPMLITYLSDSETVDDVPVHKNSDHQYSVKIKNTTEELTSPRLISIVGSSLKDLVEKLPLKKITFQDDSSKAVNHG